MVEITYQMVLSTLQTIGLLVGIYYYIIDLSYKRRNQQLRTAYSVFDIYRDEKEYSKWLEVMQLEWVDYFDFQEKYGSRNNPEMEAKWGTVFQFYDGLGYLWKAGALDLENLKELIGFGCVVMWKKYQSIVEVWRERVYLDHFVNWQHLAEALEPMIGERIQSRRPK
jgi:hypothetical protein